MNKLKTILSSLRPFTARKDAELLCGLYALFVLLIYPMLFGPNGYADITQCKTKAITVASAGFLALMVLCAVWALIRKELTLSRPSTFAIALGLYALVCGLSAVVSPGSDVLLGSGRYDGLVYTLGALLAAYLMSRFGRVRQWIFWAMGLFVLCNSVPIFLQLAGKNPFELFPNGLTYYDSGVRYTGTYLGTVGNTGILGAWLCLVFPALVVAGVRGPRKTDRLLLIPGILAGILVVVSQCEAAYVGLIAAAAVALPMLGKGRKQTAQILMAEGVAAVVALVVVLCWPADGSTLWELSELLHGRADPSFGSHRVEIWQQLLTLFRERPLLGGGPGTLASRLDIVWSRYVVETGQVLSVRVDNAHNVYLGVLCCTGLLGLIGYLFVLIRGMLPLFQKNKSAFKKAIGFGLLAYLVQDFFGLGLILVSPAAWILLGLLQAPEDSIQ